MCLTYADRGNLHQLINDVVARRRADLKAKNIDDVTATEKPISDMIDAALALNVDEETMIADLMTFFIGGFHTSASRVLFLRLV